MSLNILYATAYVSVLPLLSFIFTAELGKLSRVSAALKTSALLKPCKAGSTRAILTAYCTRYCKSES